MTVMLIVVIIMMDLMICFSFEGNDDGDDGFCVDGDDGDMMMVMTMVEMVIMMVTELCYGSPDLCTSLNDSVLKDDSHAVGQDPSKELLMYFVFGGPKVG